MDRVFSLLFQFRQFCNLFFFFFVLFAFVNCATLSNWMAKYRILCFIQIGDKFFVLSSSRYGKSRPRKKTRKQNNHNHFTQCSQIDCIGSYLPCLLNRKNNSALKLEYGNQKLCYSANVTPM